MREYSHQEFRTFLSHYRDDEAVGIDGERPVNPLTRFLREHTGNEQVWCGLIETMYVDEAKKVKIEETPDWSAGFLFFLQNRGQATGLLCREVLDIVTRGVA